jgi:hypothetical protein
MNRGTERWKDGKMDGGGREEEWWIGRKEDKEGGMEGWREGGREGGQAYIEHP